MRDSVDPLNLEIGERIRGVRNKKGWSQKLLANKAGITIQSVLYIEKGKRGLSSHTVRSISSALDVTSDYILYGRTDPGEPEDAPQTPATLSEKELSDSVKTINKVAHFLNWYKDGLRDRGADAQGEGGREDIADGPDSAPEPKEEQ